MAVVCFTALADSLATPALIDFDSRLTLSIGAWRDKGLDQWMLSLTAFGGWHMTGIAAVASF